MAEDQLENLEEALELTGRLLELGPATSVITVDGFQGRRVDWWGAQRRRRRTASLRSSCADWPGSRIAPFRLAG